MEILKIYLELITNYQIGLMLASLFLIALIIAFVFYYYTSDIKPAIITFLSIALVPLLTAIILLILYHSFKVEPNGKYILIMWGSLFINVVNLSVLVSKYAREVIKKDFDIDYVTRYHFNSTLNLFIIILLTIGTSAVFMSSEMLTILLSVLGISSIVIWFNHLIARFLLKEK